jgi:hypothetical protein
LDDYGSDHSSNHSEEDEDDEKKTKIDASQNNSTTV